MSVTETLPSRVWVMAVTTQASLFTRRSANPCATSATVQPTTRRSEGSPGRINM